MVVDLVWFILYIYIYFRYEKFEGNYFQVFNIFPSLLKKYSKLLQKFQISKPRIKENLQFYVECFVSVLFTLTELKHAIKKN